MATRLLHDLFPATLTVTSPDGSSGRVDACRVLLTDEVLVAVVDSPTGPLVVFREGYASFDRAASATGTSTVVTSTGRTVTFTKDTACGCGSRLRSWNPLGALAAVSSSQDPTA